MDLAYLRATVVRHPALRASPKLAAAVARLASPSAGKAARRRSNKRPLDSTPERAPQTAAASSSSSGGGETSAAAAVASSPAEAAPSPPSSSSAAAASSSMPTAPATAAEEEETALAVLLDAASPPRKRVALLRSSNGLVFKYTSTEVGETDRHEVPGPGLFKWIGTEGGGRPWTNPATSGDVRLRRLENIFGNWIDLEDQAPGESEPLLESNFRVQSWRLGPLRPPGTLRRFYHQLIVDLGEARSLLLTHYAAMIEPRNRRGEAETCRWSLCGSSDGDEWVELHKGTWCLAQDALCVSPVSGVCSAHRYFRFKTDGGKSGAGFEWWERLLFTRLEFYGTLFCSEALPFKRSLRRRVRDTRSMADGSSSGGGGGGGASAAGGRVAAHFVVAGQDALGLDAAIAFAHGLQPPGAAPDGTNVI